MSASDRTDLARHALEQVCSGSDASAAVGVYSPDFHDHVNGDLRIRVEDQVSEGERVASRWVADGHNRGRPIRIWGIVISRIEAGEIVEDWAASDNLHLIRQLGPWRLLLLGLAWVHARTAYRASPTAPRRR
jgi:predicted ester cyclase